MTLHQTERQREPNAYGWRTPRLGWTCANCQQWWTRKPTSLCPGVRAYHSWDAAQAAGLRTQTQWKVERRKMTLDAEPRGAMMRGAAHPSDWYWLYSEDQTTPMRPLPPRASDERDDEGAH